MQSQPTILPHWMEIVEASGNYYFRIDDSVYLPIAVWAKRYTRLEAEQQALDWLRAKGKADHSGSDVN